MIEQLVRSLMEDGASQEDAGVFVLTAGPLDLLLHLEAVWAAYSGSKLERPAVGLPMNSALGELQSLGTFAGHAPAEGPRTWHHLAYSYMLENSRAVQIFARTTHALRTSERLGVPSPATVCWLATTEALLSGALSTGALGTEQHEAQEAARRNAYWRLFGLDLAFGTDANADASFARPAQANTEFVPHLEQLLVELSKSFETAGGAGADLDGADAIADRSQKLGQSLRDHRTSLMIDRQELLAASLLGWIELSLSASSPVVRDLALEGASAAERLQDLGARVGIPAHSKAVNLFALGRSLSIMLRLAEDDPVGARNAWADSATPAGAHSRRVVTEWTAATGRSLG